MQCIKDFYSSLSLFDILINCSRLVRDTSIDMHRYPVAMLIVLLAIVTSTSGVKGCSFIRLTLDLRGLWPILII